MPNVLGRTRTGFTEVHAQSVSADCDLELYPSDIVLLRDTLSYHDDYFVPNYFKISLCIKKLKVGHEQVSLMSMHRV